MSVLESVLESCRIGGTRQVTEVNSDMAAVMMSGLQSLPCSDPRNRFYIVARYCIASLRMMDVLVVFVAKLSFSW